MFGKRLLKAARLGVPLSLIPFQLQSLRNKHPSPRLIVFTGKIGAGKTTASEWLSKHHGYQEVAFASPLKRMMEVFGFSKQQLYGSQHDKETIIHPHLGVTMREFAQKFGTDLVRDSLPELIPPLKAKLQNQSIWTRLAEMSILSLFQQRKDVVVSDARFPDEIDMLRRHGAVIIRIYRPDDLIGFMETATAAEAYSPALRIHKSETAIDHERVDFTIMNNQTQIDFYSELDKIIKSLPTYVFDRYFVSFPFPSYINNGTCQRLAFLAKITITVTSKQGICVHNRHFGH